ncbi:nuclear transport factor 2 family protein [Lysobacter sp. Root604]|uniref:nuclear transport factor 2 family protein n=1 Tax=Lysobacter sp. Root604 TaxID=1736568 RepID=UPI0006F8B3FB|nr:nuclear transport factor 2 family protein [Lysobacter sp. Root604]KRA20764.1 hypothetical protein ASD69_05510 [Lysobacter sp. Root604]
MRLYSLLPLSIALALCAPAAIAADRSADERAILQLERDICAAYEAEDAAWIGKHLAPDFTLTASNGKITTRDDEVAELAKGVTTYEVFRNHGTRLRYYGNDTAIALGITSVKGVSEGKAFAADFQFTDTYVRGPQGWVMVASHASRLPAAPATKP